MYDFKNLKTPINTGSGVADKLLLAPVDWFANNGIKAPSASGITAGDEVEITTAHTFLSGKGFFEILLAPQMNQFDTKTLGEKGFQKFDQTLKVFVPGSYLEVHEAVKNLLNVPFIVLIQDSNCGANFYYQLGTSCVPAYFTCNFSTGTTREGKKGYEVEFNYSNSFIQIYAGTIRKLGGAASTILLGVDDLSDQLNYLIGLDEANILGFEE